MTPQVFFSIIIPTLNEEKFLPSLLKDLGQQTFSNFEIIVVDAQSKDKTTQIAKRFKKVQVVISRQANVAHQRNLGGKTASGKYLLFVDADTRLPSYFLEGIKYRLAAEKPDIFTTWVSQNSRQRTNKAIAALMNLLLETGNFVKFPGAYGAMMGCKKNIFLNLKGFDTDLVFQEDADLVQRAVREGHQFAVFRDPKYVFSLRRFQKEGTMPLLRKYAKLHLSSIINGFPKVPKKDYPMLGGAYYRKKDYPRLVSRFDRILIKVKSFKDKRKLQQFIENLFLD